MVKRYCVLYPDGSVTICSPQNGDLAALAEARDLTAGFNRGEKDETKWAMSGSIEIDLWSFKELR